MDVLWFSFGLEGRISRAKYWLALVIVLAGCGFFISVFSEDVARFGALTDRLGNNRKTIAFTPFFTIGVPLALGAWVLVAASVKRLHDRNKSGWWIAPFLLATASIQQASARLGDTNVAYAFGLIACGLVVLGFVETCWLKGTPGTNRFGPDPLSPQKRVGRLVAHR